MPSRTRPAPSALGRGLSQVVANPGLVLAPLAFGGAMAAVFFGLGAAAFLAARGAVAASPAAFGRGPALANFFEGVRGVVFASPVVALLVLLAGLVVLLALTLLAAWLRAGLTGALAASDRLAAEAAPLDAYRLPSAGRVFFDSAGRRFGPFFALVNLYGLAASFVVALLVAPLAVAIAAAFAQRMGLLVVACLFLVVAIPVAIVGGAALRVVYLAAARVIAVDGVDALAAVGRAMALSKESPGRAAVLYLLTVAGAMAVGLAFVVPRVVLTMAAGLASHGAWAVFGVSGLFVVLQTTATLAYEVVIAGAFVALWPQEPPGPDGAAAPGAGAEIRPA